MVCFGTRSDKWDCGRIAVTPDGYAKIEKLWADGDEVGLDLPMQIRVKTWEGNKI